MIERLATVLPAATVEVPLAPAPERLVARSGAASIRSRIYREPAMTRAYWRTVGGTLLLEYPLVRARRGEQEIRRADGVIFLDEPTCEARLTDAYSYLAGRRVIVVQTKLGRIGMYLLGQARYSADLARSQGAEVVATVAVCEASDTALAPFAERDGITVWTTPAAQGETGTAVEHIAFSPEL